MLRLRKVPRAEFFSPLSAAWWIATTLFFGFILLAYWFSRHHGVQITVCPMKLASGLPCPFCGGTRASMSLLSGEFANAFRINPLAAFGVAGFIAWAGLWLGFGWKIETTLKAPVVTALILLILAANWAYLLNHRP